MGGGSTVFRERAQPCGGFDLLALNFAAHAAYFTSCHFGCRDRIGNFILMRYVLDTRSGNARDEPCATLECDVVPRPAHGYDQSITEADQIIDMRHAPESPRNEPGEPQTSELRHRAFAADRRHGAEIAITEGRRRPPNRAGRQQVGNISALLFRNGGDTWQGLSVAPAYMCGVADDEYVWVPRHGKIGCDLYAPRVVHVGAKPIPDRRCHDAGGPHDRACLDAFLADGYSAAIATSHTSI